MNDWLLYGVNGYTGRLIAREAVGRGLRPILAGRNREAVEAAARELGCESRVFALDDAAAIAKNLAGMKLVLNCAGPFSQTAPAMIAACLKARASYLDITGEIDVIEHAAAQDGAAQAAGVALVPAVGFDVVPTDCLAALLASELPDATHLTLAFTGTGAMSPGTTKTALEGMPHGGRVRRDGRIERVPALAKKLTVPFPSGPREAVLIPWGDVAGAYYTTGIPNIETYMAMSEHDSARMRRVQWLKPLLKFPPTLRWLQHHAAKSASAPDERELAEGRSEVWGEVRNAAGRSVTATLETPNAYRLTVLTALAAVERVLAGTVAPGFQTPARAFGREFILSMPGVRFAKQPPR